tara:strand:+ start:1421 stop:2044 length:624 start_codon:yes stop_codon:yes gene_type:complete
MINRSEEYDINYAKYCAEFALRQNKGANGDRDSERTRCYKSEWKFQNVAKIRTFKDISEAQKFANRVTKSATYEKLYVEAMSVNRIERLFVSKKVEVVNKKRNTGRGFAGQATYNRITLDTYVGMDEYTLLHELAHCSGHMHHGRSFRQALVKLVSRFMGTDNAKLLKKEFKGNRLTFNNARTPMTFDKWFAARERMTKLRERRGES